MAKLVVLLVVLLTISACGNVEPSSTFDGKAFFHLEATPDRHQATYTRFVGTYIYKIRLEGGIYTFSFDGSPELGFELKDKGGRTSPNLNLQVNSLST